MAPLEEPQQLWGRPGWREATGNAPGSRSREKKQRKTTLNDVTNPDEDAQVVEENDMAERKANRRVLAFVDCTNPGGQVIENDSDDEPIVERWRRASNASFKELTARALKPGRGDAMLPSMQTESLGPPWSPLLSPADVSRGVDGATFNTLSVPQLSDEPSDTVRDAQRHAELLQEILRRL